MCPAAATQSIDGPELRTLDDCRGRMFFTGVLHSLNLVGIRSSLETIGVGLSADHSENDTVLGMNEGIS